MDRTTLEQDAPPGAGIVPMSLGGACPGHRIERGPKRGTTPVFCKMTCGAFDPAGTLKPEAVRLPPAMDWACVNWRALSMRDTHSPDASVGPDRAFFRALAHTDGLTPDQVRACDEMAGLCHGGATVRRDTDAGQSADLGGSDVQQSDGGGRSCA